MSEAVNHPSDTPLFPIREVSRLTGVNAVTLRAWERRYGLIKPQRTPKGHRLYSREDIERVEQVLQWLNRGVPVSQVRALLDRPETTTATLPDISNWPSQRAQLTSAVESLDQNRLESLFSQSLALYPAPLCVAALWEPVVRELEEDWNGRVGDTLPRRHLEAFLRTRIGIRLFHANPVAPGPTLLLMPSPDGMNSLWALLTALIASDHGYRVRLFDAPLPLGELPLAGARLAADALLLAGGQAASPELIQRQLPELAEQLTERMPLCLCGPMARIHADELTKTRIELLGDDLGTAMMRLKTLVPVA